MVGTCVALIVGCMNYKEPVLQLRLVELGLSPNIAGLFFSLDLVAYTFAVWYLSLYTQEQKDFNFLIWLSSALSVPALFLMGTIHVFGVPDSLYPFVVGSFILGFSSAFAINNAVPCIIDELK